MSFRRHWAARTFLWEERFGLAIRQAERDEKAQQAQLASDYERTVALLKKRQEAEQQE